MRPFSGRFSRPVERCLKACQILAEPPCRVASSISRSNGSRPSFSRSRESRLAPCRALRFHRAACSCLHGVSVWHSEELARPSRLLDSETLPQRNPLAAWLGREGDVLAGRGPAGTFDSTRLVPSANLTTNVTRPASCRLHAMSRRGFAALRTRTQDADKTRAILSVLE